MKKMKLILKTSIIFAVALAFVIPESALEVKDIFYENIPTILEGRDLPTIVINFAGNPGDMGGPYWRPPGESDILDEENEGDFRDGYYTNDSRQSEDWIYINLTVTDTAGVDEVWLHWYDATTNVWINNSHQFIQTSGDFWEFNSSGIITNIESGHDYSFDILAIDTYGNYNQVAWKKIGIGGSYTRRYVQLDCTPKDITYRPFYLRSHTSYTGMYVPDDMTKKDRLHHDQAAIGSSTDTGYLNSTLPKDTAELRSCLVFTGYWFEDSICIEPFTLSNIYYHYWALSTSNDVTMVGWFKTRSSFAPLTNYYDPPKRDNNWSHITYNINDVARDFYLDAHLLEVNQTNFTDNDIYELYVEFSQSNLVNHEFYTISNRSFTSFVIFNVPDNDTLNESYFDTDNDGLSDWNELYVTYTNPFLFDTDSDGATDSEEINGASNGYINSDPNDYTDTTDYRYTPDIKIVKPEKALYINNKKIIPFFTTIIINGIDIKVDLSSNRTIVDRMEFYIDDQLKATDTTYPYSFMWDEKIPLEFRHKIKALTYNNAGNSTSDEIMVWRFF